MVGVETGYQLGFRETTVLLWNAVDNFLRPPGLGLSLCEFHGPGIGRESATSMARSSFSARVGEMVDTP
jgi:hypothetical protein